MILIISGPSCVGKSTFIKHNQSMLSTHHRAKLKTLFAFEQDLSAKLLSHDYSYFHYNILRPFTDFRQQHRIVGSIFKLFFKKYAYSKYQDIYDKDKSLTEIINHSNQKKAIVLVLGKKTLLKRMASRTQIEPSCLKAMKDNNYDSLYWQSIIKDLDIASMYVSWVSTLSSARIPYDLIDSSDKNFAKLATKREMIELILDT